MMRNNIKVKGERLKVKGERLKVKGLVLSIFIFPFAMICQAQDDSDINRSVTVERDFQPTIQAAGKVVTKPAVVETKIEPAEVEYSDYTAEVNPGSVFNPLLSQPTRFEGGRKYNGYIRGGLGHANTLFDFGYHLDDGKKSILDVYAHHKAKWGLDALSKSNLGLEFTHTFTSSDLYFGVNGGNVFYHKYGHFYDYSLFEPGAWTRNAVAYPKPYTISEADKTALWTAEAYLGIKANAKEDFQYKVQTGYMLFAKVGAVSEHQIRTQASFDWHADEHHVGAKIYVQNNFMQRRGALADSIDASLYNPRHNFRIEPYYAYEGRRLRLHLGVNLDMNIGRGKNSLSGTENISFAPSPHINLEAQIARQWLTLYADITGNHGLGSLQSYMEGNRYRLIHPGIVSHHSCPYTPVDAELGFHIRPHRNVLIELHGGYALMLDQMTLIANTDATTTYGGVKGKVIPMMAGDLAYTYSDYGRGKIGGQLNYHYRDIVRINLEGDYYLWSTLEHEKIAYTFTGEDAAVTAFNAGTNKHVYDRPNWTLGLRIDGRIDKHWSLYSDNHLAGSRLALAKDGEHTLKPTIDLDLGLQYDMWVGKMKDETLKVKGGGEQILRPEPKPNLTLFFQLNNWLHRKNELYYGYRSQGINCLLGVTYRF